MFCATTNDLTRASALPPQSVLRHSVSCDSVQIELYATHSSGTMLAEGELLDLVLPMPFGDSLYRQPVYFVTTPPVKGTQQFKALMASLDTSGAGIAPKHESHMLLTVRAPHAQDDAPLSDAESDLEEEEEDLSEEGDDDVEEAVDMPEEDLSDSDGLADEDLP